MTNNTKCEWFVRPQKDEPGSPPLNRYYIGLASAGWNLYDRVVASDLFKEDAEHIVALHEKKRKSGAA